MSTTTSTERTKLGYGLREEEGEDFWLFGALVTIKEVRYRRGTSWPVQRDGYRDAAGDGLALARPPRRGRMVLRPRGRMRGLHRRCAPDHDSRWVCFRPQGRAPHFFGGPNGGKMLVWAGGAKFEGLLREIAEPAPKHVLPPPPEGSPDMDMLLPIADKWAYDILGPPGSTPR